MNTPKLVPVLVASCLLLASCGRAPRAPSRVPLPSGVASSAPSSAQPPSDAASAPDVTLEPAGDVSIQSLGSDAWAPVSEVVMLAEGDGIRTGKASTATVTFQDGSVARVNAESTLYLASLGTAEAQDVSLQLVSGEVWSRVRSIVPGGGYEVRTDTTLAEVRGTEFDVAVGEEDGTTVETYEHAVAVATVEVDPEDPAAEPIITEQATVGEGESLAVTPAMMRELRDQRTTLRAMGKDPRAKLKLATVRSATMGDERKKRDWITKNRALKTEPLKLTPEQRAKMRGVLQRITSLPPAARTQLLKQLQLTPLQRAKLRALPSGVPPSTVRLPLRSSVPVTSLRTNTNTPAPSVLPLRSLPPASVVLPRTVQLPSAPSPTPPPPVRPRVSLVPIRPPSVPLVPRSIILPR